MSTQLFKEKMPNEAIFDLLNKICLKNEKYYIFNLETFKKGVYNEVIQELVQCCVPYYHISKRNKYLEKKLTYNSFTTILRQLCNYNQINYTSQIKYDKSTYVIVYYIYYV